MKIDFEFLSLMLPYLLSLAPVIVTQLIIYNRLKWDVEELKNSVNGIGKKLGILKDRYGEDSSETILRFADLRERISKVEVLLDTLLRPKYKNGQI